MDSELQVSEELLSYSESLERWEFLKRLPHRLIRDIAFVILSPPLLLDSLELPSATAFISVGSRDKWDQTADWLKNLDLKSVKNWFTSKRESTRLGDHFANCVEYVILYSPTSQVETLFCSQQVMEQMDVNKSFPNFQGNDESPVFGIHICDNGSETFNKIESSLQDKPPHEMAPSIHAFLTRRERKQLSKLKKKSLNKGTNTVGEFDFLFQAQHAPNPAFPKDDLMSRDNGAYVEHWEVSVKFLLYTGPWEPFGLETPEFAWWTMKDSRSGSLCPQGDYEEQFDISKSMHFTDSMNWRNVWNTDGFLGCFLGPHVGETLADRKERLKKQLLLSSKPCARPLLMDLFFPSQNLNQAQLPDTIQESTNAVQKHKGADCKLLVRPRAFLKGYLFYEYRLWHHLKQHGIRDQFMQKRSFGEASFKNIELQTFEGCNNALTSNKNAITKDGNCIRQLANWQKSRLNSQHWAGWWVHICKFTKLVSRSFHQNSKWYIVPKKEWLSPIIINESDKIGCSRLLSIEAFLEIAEEVAQTAEKRQVPRMRRFMVAEMCWENLVPNEHTGKDVAETGAWMEVSRGFIVEDTWPDTKNYEPHGFLISWSPSAD